MATVSKSAIVAHPRETMFDLVDDVAKYPQFLRWCRAASVLERTPQHTLARLEIDYHGLRTHFTTRNAKERPSSMKLALVEGPFESLAGEWRFTALGDAGCRVELELDYSLAAGPLRALLGSLFGQIAATMVESFVERAESIGGAA